MFLFSIILLVFETIWLSVSAGNVSTTASILEQAGLSSETEIFLRSDANYTEEVQQRYTIHDEPTYVASVKPALVSDVQTLIKICSLNNIPFLATGGGHGFSTTLAKLQNGVAIDLSNFRNVSVDASANTMTIGGAVKFGDVIEPLWQAGKEIPTGASPCVGMVGATLGGGVSRYNGLHGMILDSLRSIELVTSSGDLVTASQTQNADLFWGMRGAGMNFGIVVSAVYEVYDLTSATVTNADIVFPRNASSTVISWFKSYEHSMPAELAPILFLGYNKAQYGGTFFIVNIIYAGTKDHAQPLIQPLLDANPLVANITEIPWRDITATAFFGAGAAPCPKGQNFNIYGSSLRTYDPSTFEDFFNNMDDFFVQFPDAQNTSFAIEHFPKVGVQAVPSDATAYPHRDITGHILFTYQYSNTALNDAIDEFAQRQRSLLQSASGFPQLQVYVNYAHGDEGPVPPYTEANLATLRDLKAHWDPKGLFGFTEPFT